MDTDSDSKQNNQTHTEPERPDGTNAGHPNVSHIFFTNGLRCIVCNDNALDRFLLVNGWYFLLPISIVFWIIFLATVYL